MTPSIHPHRAAKLRAAALFIPLLAAPCLFPVAAAAPPLLAPASLTCDSQRNPLGTSADAPQLSWQLRDARPGARQTAYRILVASSKARLASARPDVWDSGRVESSQSLNVQYRGPALKGQTRYYWLVRTWNSSGAPYPASAAAWWETGLSAPEDWKASWIGAETGEHRAVRDSAADWVWDAPANSPHDSPAGLHAFRLAFDLPASPKSVLLFLTAVDTPSAWIDGRQVLKQEAKTPWGNMPWGTYRRLDIAALVHPGPNTLAIGATLFEPTRGAMSAVLLWQSQDGGYHLLRTGAAGWRSSANPAPRWTETAFDDSAWRAAETVAPAGANAYGRPWPVDSVNQLRRAFTVEGRPRSVRLYATALGAYRFQVNGLRVGDQVLSPGWTDYRQRVFYQTYDLTGMVTPGSNMIGAVLAPGWYSTPLQWLRQPYNYGNTPPALRAQLRIEAADGSVTWINTDSSWQSHPSPVLSAEIYDGESYDARLETPGWDTSAAKDEHGWRPVDVIRPLEPKILPQSFEPIRVERTLEPVSVTTLAGRATIFDFGQNLSGVARLHISGVAGTEVRLRFGEVLNKDGSLYTENLRSAKVTDSYTLRGRRLKGSRTEDFEPDFTFHGFRYIEVTGAPGKLSKSSLEAVVFHTAAPFSAQLRTGSPMINKLWSNIEWGQRSNFIGVPTDCPQRDERLGWTADAQVFWRTASYNMQIDSFSRKYAGDLSGTAGGDGMFGIYAPGTLTASNAVSPGWSDAGIIIPWTAWLQYGDTRIVDENWNAMTRYLSVIEQANPDHLWRNQSGIGFGDWLAPGNKTSNLLVATAYWAYDAQLMAQMAHALHHQEEESRYEAMFEAIRAAFQARYVHPDGSISAGTMGRPTGGDAVEHATAMESDDRKAGPGTQTGYALALYMKLVPVELRAAAGDRLVTLIHANDDRLATGFLGTPYVLQVLSDIGYTNLAYKLLLNTRYPSWGYQVEHGATTMWERWNGDQMMDDPGMNSFNHYAYGAVAAWIYEYAAGIDASSDDPGFHRIHLNPHFDRSLGSVDFSYDSPYGAVSSQWTAPAHGPVLWTVVIPPNTAAYLSISEAEARRYTMDGHPLKPTAGTQEYAVDSGRHRFSVDFGTHPGADSGKAQ
ncbi:MAG TPA: family 78 glycoside hydrolase catalytic domain [Acidisarcina sp.]